MKKVIVWLPLAALAGLAALFAVFALNNDPRVAPDALVGRPLPTATLAPLDGGAPVPLRSTIEGPTLINVFASWCGPCEIEHPELTALQRQGVRIVGLAYKDRPENSRAFLNRLGDPFAVVLTDPEGRAGIDLGISGVPETFVVGADGVVLEKVTGPLTPETRRRLAETALQAAR